jgi:hypothetical protein
MKFDEREFRANVRQVLLSGHGVTVAQADRRQLANAVNQAAQMWMGFFPDQQQYKADVQSAVKDMFKGK